jgi:hypothetical protein
MVASTGIIPGKEEMIRPTNRNSSVPEEVFFFSMISILGSMISTYFNNNGALS